MQKIVADCSNNVIETVELSQEEITQIENDIAQQAEQDLLNSLNPTEKEVLMAEIELNTLNLLLEVGLI